MHWSIKLWFKCSMLIVSFMHFTGRALQHRHFSPARQWLEVLQLYKSNCPSQVALIPSWNPEIPPFRKFSHTLNFCTRIISGTACIHTSVKKVNNKSLSEQHLATSQHATPTNVRLQPRVWQSRQICTICEPDPWLKVQLEVIKTCRNKILTFLLERGIYIICSLNWYLHIFIPECCPIQ